MRVGISAEFLGTKRCGTATYTRNLLLGLSRLDGPDRFHPYLASRSGLPLVPPAANVEPRLVPPYSAWLRLPLSLPAELLARPVDLLHAQGWGPPWSPVPMVVTIHDLSFETHPEMYTPAMRRRLCWLARRTVGRARMVIASSRHTVGDLERLYGVPAERIRQSYPAFEPDGLGPAEASEIARVRASYGLERPYVLYLGSLEPRKNVDRLIEAYAALRRAEDVPHQLVLAGKPLWLSREILELPARLGLEQDVRFLGQVPQEDLGPLYSGAAVFALLSGYEGFGYPPLEAMACGAPVLCARTTSLPEVVGDAGLLVDPNRPDQVVAALRRLLTSPELRADLRARGFRRATEFGAEAQAREVAAIYQECLGEPRRAAALAGRGAQPWPGLDA